MRRTALMLLAATSLSFGFAQAALAADMPARAPVYKAPAAVAPYYNWTGFYLGAHGGYAWGSGSLSINGFGDADSVDLDLKGGFAGGQLGYNYQPAGSPWVFGIEVDSAWADITGSISDTDGFSTVTLSSKIDYIGSLRGRIGYSWDRALLYGTGGLAWAHNKMTFGVAVPGFAASISDDQTRVGWTIGAGLEYAFAPSWSAKVEYLFADYGSETFFSNIIPGVSLAADRQINSVKFGVNYRFGGSVY